MGADCGSKHVWDDDASSVFEWQSFYSQGMDNLDGDVCIRTMPDGEMQDKECDELRNFRCLLECE